MRIALGSDHAGYAHKEAAKAWLAEHGHELIDCGCFSEASCDYPDFVRPAAELVARGEAERCLVFGGSGNGEAIVANRLRGIRCPVVWSEETARLGRSHNNANAMAFGGRQITVSLMLRCLEIFLSEPYEGGRHGPRLAKIDGV